MTTAQANDINSWRAATLSTPIGTKIKVLPAREGELFEDGEIVGTRKLSNREWLVVDIGGNQLRIHPAACRVSPLAFLRDGTPIWAGDRLFIESSERCGSAVITGVVNRDILSFSYDPNRIGFAYTGSQVALRMLRKEWPEKYDTTTGRPRSSAAQSGGQHRGPYFVNLYTSLPNGERLIPGSVVFKSADAAKKAKHNAPMFGTFELNPVG